MSWIISLSLGKNDYSKPPLFGHDFMGRSINRVSLEKACVEWQQLELCYTLGTLLAHLGHFKWKTDRWEHVFVRIKKSQWKDKKPAASICLTSSQEILNMKPKLSQRRFLTVLRNFNIRNKEIVWTNYLNEKKKSKESLGRVKSMHI